LNVDRVLSSLPALLDGGRRQQHVAIGNSAARSQWSAPSTRAQRHKSRVDAGAGFEKVPRFRRNDLRATQPLVASARTISRPMIFVVIQDAADEVGTASSRTATPRRSSAASRLPCRNRSRAGTRPLRGTNSPMRVGLSPPHVETVCR